MATFGWWRREQPYNEGLPDMPAVLPCSAWGTPAGGERAQQPARHACVAALALQDVACCPPAKVAFAQQSS